MPKKVTIEVSDTRFDDLDDTIMTTEMIRDMIHDDVYFDKDFVTVTKIEIDKGA